MTNYGKQKILAAQFNPGGSVDFNYLFESNIQSAVYNDLGLTQVTPANLLLYSSEPTIFEGYPYPGNAKRKTAVGYDSSYYSDAKLTAGLGGGFQAAKAKAEIRDIILPGTTGALSVTCFVTLWGGLKYAWNMAITRYQALNQYFGSLGIEVATDADLFELTWGCTYPRPPMAQLIQDGGANGQDSYKVFCSIAAMNSLPDGFTLLSRGANIYDGLIKRATLRN